MLSVEEHQEAHDPEAALCALPPDYVEAARRCDDYTQISIAALPPQDSDRLRLALLREGRGLVLHRFRRDEDAYWLTPRLKARGAA